MSEMFTNPVAPGADPFILKDGDTYYLYPTSGDAFGYRVFTSNNLVEWTAQGYCLLYDDIYTDSSKPTDFYGFWAPELIKYNDKYYIICSVQNHPLRRQVGKGHKRQFLIKKQTRKAPRQSVAVQ